MRYISTYSATRARVAMALLASGFASRARIATINDFGIFDAAGGPVLADNPTNAQVEAFIGRAESRQCRQSGWRSAAGRTRHQRRPISSVIPRWRCRCLPPPAALRRIVDGQYPTRERHRGSRKHVGPGQFRHHSARRRAAAGSQRPPANYDGHERRAAACPF